MLMRAAAKLTADSEVVTKLSKPVLVLAPLVVVCEFEHIETFSVLL